MARGMIDLLSLVRESPRRPVPLRLLLPSPSECNCRCRRVAWPFRRKLHTGAVIRETKEPFGVETVIHPSFLKKGILARFLDLEGPLDGAACRAPFARLRGLQGDGQFVGLESGELLGSLLLVFWAITKTAFVPVPMILAMLLGAVGQADRDLKDWKGPEHFADGDRATGHGQIRGDRLSPLFAGQGKGVWPFLASTVRVSCRRWWLRLAPILEDHHGSGRTSAGHRASR